MAEFSTVLQESRVFPPSPEFSAKAHLKSLDEYQKLYAQAQADPEGYWGDRAKEELFWETPFS